MHDVSTFLDELSAKAGGKGSAVLRSMILEETGEKITPPMLSMWRHRGIPWRLHDGLRRVCARLGVEPDPVAWRTCLDRAA